MAWATTGVVVVAGAGIAAQTSMAAASRPAQKTYTGRAFDTCTAPSLAAMKAWNTGFYGGAVAVYIGGKNRGCGQPNLTASWVKSVSAAGWKLIPLYVGVQPPCQTSRNPERFTASTAASLGASNAKDAVAKATALGMKPGSPIYLNMESYDITNKECNDATLTYVRSFAKTLRAKTYRAGYYGFSSSSAKATPPRRTGPTSRATSGTRCGTTRTPPPPTGPGTRSCTRTTAVPISTWSTARRPAAATPSPSIATPGTPRSLSSDRTVSRLATVPRLQLTPVAQSARHSCLDEVVHEGPCAIDSQDEVATERSQVIHDRDVDHDICCGGTVSDEQGRPLSVVEPMDDRLITLKAQSQQGELTDWQSDFDVTLATGAQFVEVICQFPHVRISLDGGVPSRLQRRRRPCHAHLCTSDAYPATWPSPEDSKYVVIG